MEGEDVDDFTRNRKSPRFAVRKIKPGKQNPIVNSSTNETQESRPSKKRKRTGKKTCRSPQKKSHNKKQVGYKCCPQMLHELLQGLDNDQKLWVEELGFGALLLMKEVRLPKALTLWLIDQVDWKRKCLCIRGRRFYLKNWISGALDLPNGELKVPLPKSGRGKSKIRNPTEQEKEYRAADGGRGMKVKDSIKALLAEKDILKFKKQFMLVLLCIYLAPTSGHFINRSYLAALVNIDQVKDMDWCEFVVNYLVDGIRDYLDSTAANVNVHGCVHILCLMYIDIVKSKQIKVPRGITRVQCVTTELMDLLESLDMKIGRNNVPSFGNLEINPDIESEETGSDDNGTASRGGNSSRNAIPEGLPKPKRKMKQSGVHSVNSSRHKKQKVGKNDKPLPKSLDEIEDAYNEKRSKISQNYYEKFNARLKKLDKRRKDDTEAFMKNQLEEQKLRITSAISSDTSHSEDEKSRDPCTNIDNGLVGTSQGSGRSQSDNGEVGGQSNGILPTVMSPVEVAKDGDLQEETIVESEINNMIVDGRTNTSNTVSDTPVCQATHNIGQCSVSNADGVITKEDNLSVQENPAIPVDIGLSEASHNSREPSPMPLCLYYQPQKVVLPIDATELGNSLAVDSSDDVLREVCQMAVEASSEALSMAARDNQPESAKGVNTFGQMDVEAGSDELSEAAKDNPQEIAADVNTLGDVILTNAKLQNSSSSLAGEHVGELRDMNAMEEQDGLTSNQTNEHTTQTCIDKPEGDPAASEDSLGATTMQVDSLEGQQPLCISIGDEALDGNQKQDSNTAGMLPDAQNQLELESTDIPDSAKDNVHDEELIFISPTYTFEELEVNESPDISTPAAPRDMLNVVPLTSAIPDGHFFVTAGSVNTAVKSRPKRIHKNEHTIEGIAECVKGTTKDKTAINKTYTEHVENNSLNTEGLGSTKICIRGFHITESEFVQSLVADGSVGPRFMWICCVAIMEDWGSRSKFILNQTIMRELMVSPDECKKDVLIKRLTKLPLKNVEQIYLPAPLVDQWILIVVNLVGRSVEIYDSVKSHKKGQNPFQEIWDKIGPNLQDALSQAIAKDTPIYSSFTVNCAQIHTQSNQKDSGFEVIRALLCHNGKDLIGYCKKNMSVYRKEIAHTLLYHRFNDLNPTRSGNAGSNLTVRGLSFDSSL